MRLLVTNDDGVRAPGIAVLAAALVGAGHEVVIAGPLNDMSGSGAGIGPVHMGEGLDLVEIELPDVAGVRCVGLDGPPALAVMAARLGAFGEPPDAVVSGINPGCNTGRSTLHSGTVGAALTAANFGCSGLAVSLDISEPMHWDTAAALAVSAMDWLAGAPVRTVLNLNAPARALADIAGVRRARLAPFGTVRTAIAEQREGHIQLELRDTGVELEPDTDTALIGAGFATITPLVGIRADEVVDISAIADG